MQTETLERAEKVAQDFIEEREKSKAEAEQAKLTDEQKEAKAKELAETQKKTEEEAKAKAEAEAEVVAKAEELMEKPQEELTDEEKKILDDLAKAEEALDEKDRIIKSNKKNLRRIDKLTARLREAEAERSTLINGYEELKKELEEIKKTVTEPKKKEDFSKKTKDIERQMIAEMMEQDSELPYEERREMTNEDLQGWFSEDPVAAQEWISRREVRRAQDRQRILSQGDNEARAQEFLSLQEQSIKRAVAQMPNIKPDKEIAILLKEHPQDEVISILEKKYPEYKLCNEIVNEAIDLQRQNKESLLAYPDFGDRLIAEVKKRMANNKPNTSADKPTKKVYSEEEVQQRIKEAQEMERKRLERVDTGTSSTTLGVGSTPKKDLSEDEKFLTRHGQKAGLNQDQIDRIIKRHNDRMRSGVVAARHAKDDED